jgi:hypothetical protein
MAGREVEPGAPDTSASATGGRRSCVPAKEASAGHPPPGAARHESAALVFLAIVAATAAALGACHRASR